MFWIITKGPNEGRSSSHVHGPPTSQGPTHVFSEEAVGTLLGRYYVENDDEIRWAIEWLKNYDG